MVRINDIGQASLESTDDSFSVFADGKSAIFMGVMPKSDANPLDISTAIREIFPGIIHQLPPGAQAEIFWDGATFISAALHEVQRTFIEASLLVFLVFLL